MAVFSEKQTRRDAPRLFSFTLLLFSDTEQHSNLSLRKVECILLFLSSNSFQIFLLRWLLFLLCFPEILSLQIASGSYVVQRGKTSVLHRLITSFGFVWIRRCLLWSPPMLFSFFFFLFDFRLKKIGLDFSVCAEFGYIFNSRKYWRILRWILRCFNMCAFRLVVNITPNLRLVAANWIWFRELRVLWNYETLIYLIFVKILVLIRSRLVQWHSDYASY